MENIFEHFTIIHELAKFVNWADIHSLKKINKLCSEVCEREITRRCLGVMHGYLPIGPIKNSNTAKKPRYALTATGKMLESVQFHNPSLVLMYTNRKHVFGLDEIIDRQCRDGDSVVCMVYSSRGCVGLNRATVAMEGGVKHPGLWWIGLPRGADVRLVRADGAEIPDCKLVIVLNSASCAQRYKTRVFSDESDDESDCDYNQSSLDILYAGGLVRGIEIYDHQSQCFKSVDHVSIAVCGADLVVTHCVMDERFYEASTMRAELEGLRARTEATLAGRAPSWQCLLVFSCYLRYGVSWPQPGADAEATGSGSSGGGDRRKLREYDLLTAVFPGVPLQGVFCEGEIFHHQPGLLTLVRALHPDDLRGVTSVYTLLSWA